MKLFNIALGLGLLGSAAVTAAPYYVGQEAAPQNNVSLGIQFAPTKGDDSSIQNTTGKSGSITAFELGGDYRVMENLSLGAELPFFVASKENSGTANKSKSALGNIALGGNWNMDLSNKSSDYRWGYSAALNAYLPTSRKDQAVAVAYTNPTTDFFLYSPRSTTAHAQTGLYIDADRVYAQTTLGYAHTMISKKAGFPTDKNRNLITWQTAGTYRAMANLDLNLEYNAMLMDSATRIVTEKNSKFRHAISPSVSGTYENVLAQAYANLPLDAATRETQTVSFGATVGYMF